MGWIRERVGLARFERRCAARGAAVLEARDPNPSPNIAPVPCALANLRAVLPALRDSRSRAGEARGIAVVTAGLSVLHWSCVSEVDSVGIASWVDVCSGWPVARGYRCGGVERVA
ncbi:hypothetical protein CF640_36455 [Burkholderia pseudomallei]|nr:hypothetical protein CF640_36455 [Burkholderia pseudomallei]